MNERAERGLVILFAFGSTFAAIVFGVHAAQNVSLATAVIAIGQAYTLYHLWHYADKFDDAE